MWKLVVLYLSLFIMILKSQKDDDDTEFSSLSHDIQQDISNIFGGKPLTGLLSKQNVSADKIKYYVYLKRDPNINKVVNPSDPHQFDDSSHIAVLIHGWSQNRSTLWYELLKNAFMERTTEYDVLEVDWSKYSNLNYISSANSTEDVGGVIGQFIVKLIKERNVLVDNILVIGHSLGGQVASFVGKKVFALLNQKLPRIIALDPAGPLFEASDDSKRLNKKDAKVVHVIHTDGGKLGMQKPCGTIDFFPNGGSNQKGCKKINLNILHALVYCDHHRSYKFFIEGVALEDKFVSKKCPLNKDNEFNETLCSDEAASMGSLNLTNTGTFYLETNSDPPFSK